MSDPAEGMVTLCVRLAWQDFDQTSHELLTHGTQEMSFLKDCSQLANGGYLWGDADQVDKGDMSQMHC